VGNDVSSVRRPKFTHHRNSLSDDSVELTFFFGFFVKFGGDAPILWEVDKKIQLGCGGCQHTGLQHEYHFHSPTFIRVYIVGLFKSWVPTPYAS